MWLVSLILWLLKTLIGTLSSLFVIVLCILWLLQRHLLYFPDHWLDNLFNLSGKRSALIFNGEGYRNPMEHNIPYEQVCIQTEDGVTLVCWFLQRPEGQEQTTMLYFHGNAGNVGHRMQNLYEMYHLCRASVLIVDYRGFGSSGGSPCERGITKDALACLKYLKDRPDVDSNNIVVFGRSLGGAVSIKLSSLVGENIRALIVENTFTNIDDMVIEIAGGIGVKGNAFLRVPLYFYITDHWNSKEHIRQIRVPIMFISGLEDELIPPLQMQKLHDFAERSSHRELVRFEGGTHNDTFEVAGHRYYDAINDFLQNIGIADN